MYQSSFNFSTIGMGDLVFIGIIKNINNRMASEQLSYELYKWLSPLDILPSNLRYKSNGNFQLDNKSSDGLMNGSLISKLVLQLANDHGATVNQPLISSIKQSNTPAARTYNWNILAQSFLKLNVVISKETQKQITSGNFSTLNRFLLDLHKKFNPKKPQKKEQGQSEELNLKKLQVLQTYSQAETFLEMVIMIISQNFSLTPKQTISTLSENAKYYAHMVVKGIKNSFAQVLSMIDTFIKEMPNLMYLCEKSPQKNTEFFLDLIKPTLISRQPDVSKKGSNLFRVFLDESLKYNSKNLIYQILCRENVGFDFLYMALKRHPDLTTDFTYFIFPLIREALKDFFEVHLKRTINNQQQYLKILMKLLEGLTSIPQCKGKLKQSGLIDIWLKASQQSFNNTKNKEESLINEQTKLLYLQLLCNLWKQYATEINEEQAQELLIKGIEQLKKNTRKEIYTIKIPAMLRLFDFLHFLADGKNKIAAILYKKLIFLFIQNHHEQAIRQIILSNFTVMLRKYPTIPIDFLLDPLLKQLINSQGKTYILNIYDFEFIIELCKHPKMDADFGLIYLEYLSKLYIKSFIYAKLVIRVIQLLTNRFCQEETIVQFLKKNVDSTLNLYGILIFNKKKMTKQNAIINKQKKSLAIELIKHYIQLQHQQLNQFILERVTGLYNSWNDEKRYTDKGLKYLISLYGDVDEITLQAKIVQNRRFQAPPESQATIQASNSENALSKPTPKSESYKEMQYMKEQGIGYKPTVRTSKTRMDELAQKSPAKPNPKVLKDIETLKERLKEQANRKLNQQNNERKKLNLQNNQNSIQLLQRNLSLGYAKLTPLQEDKILFDFDSVKPKQLKMTLKFHLLSELEEHDEGSTEVILKHYARQIKSLYLKYALISATQSRRDEPNPILSFTEVIKMIKEKNISNISKVVISDMIASINYNKRKEKNILSGIQETQFNEFLIKLTDYTIQQQKNSAQMPFGLKLQEILKKLFQGEAFYENKFRIKEPANIIKLRDQISKGQTQQSIDIPEGYKKVKEGFVDLHFQISSNSWGIHQRYQIGYEITDWLINKCMGFHIITPQVQIGQRYTLIQIPKPIKPKILKNETDPKIKVQPQENKAETQVLNMPKQTKRLPRPVINQHRSFSHQALASSKTKPDPAEKAQQQRLQKQKITKQLKYAQKLKENLERLRQEKSAKQEVEKAKQLQEKEKERKKQQERKKYLQSNKQKIKQLKMKEEQQKKARQERQKQQKQLQKAQSRKRQLQMLQKHKEMIKQKAQKLNQRKKQLQNSREKKKASIPAKKEKQKQKQIQKQKQKALEPQT